MADVLVLQTPSGDVRLTYELHRSHLGSATADLVVHRAGDEAGFLLMAPEVGRHLGSLLEESGVNFVDLAGNCHLQIGDRYLARIDGRRPPKSRPSDASLRAPSYRVLFCFLAKPELVDAPARTTAEAAGVSPQTANAMRNRLLEQGILLEAGGARRWAPTGWREALTQWLAGFDATLFPSLLHGRFRARERDPKDLERRLEPLLDGACTWRYGGGAAAARLTEYYRGDRTVLYVDAPSSDLARSLQLVPDHDGRVIVAEPPAELAFESPHAKCVHPLLVYADLLSEGHDRARDAAAELYRRELAAMDHP